MKYLKLSALLATTIFFVYIVWHTRIQPLSIQTTAAVTSPADPEPSEQHHGDLDLNELFHDVQAYAQELRNAKASEQRQARVAYAKAEALYRSRLLHNTLKRLEAAEQPEAIVAEAKDLLRHADWVLYWLKLYHRYSAGQTLELKDIAPEKLREASKELAEALKQRDPAKAVKEFLDPTSAVRSKGKQGVGTLTTDMKD